MVLTERPERAFVVPDEATWTLAGSDPAMLGLSVTTRGETARVLLVPAEVPEPLLEAVLDEWRGAGKPLEVRTGGAVVLRGRQCSDVLADAGGSNPDHGKQVHGEHRPSGEDDPSADSPHADHGEDDHHDMMAIVGAPSLDGLVMEAIDFRFGPLSAALAGGIVLDVSLDGDVVAACAVRATLRAGVDGPAQPCDALAPVAWRVADSVASEVASGSLPAARTQWERVAAVELERALSHLAWLRSLGRMLGWAQLTEAAQRGVIAVAAVHGNRAGLPQADAVLTASTVLAPVDRLVAGRRFAWRTSGRGKVDDEALAGPNARAAGRSTDARQDDPLYAGIGFVAVTERAGDARARAQVRMAESRQSLALAAAALERAQTATGGGVPNAFATPAGACVEGARGPLVASRSTVDAHPRRSAPGAGASLLIAGSSVIGLEWSAALVTLASFDLSPWTVDP